MAEAIFDADALIAEFGDEDLIAELAQLLLHQVDDQLNAVYVAIESGNATALKSAAHKIKGGMGTFGASPVIRLAVALEALGRDGRLEHAAPLAAELNDEVRALCEGARRWLETRAA
jgi:HPt (histidine-containing phosphotransfer) domain-containing protein